MQINRFATVIIIFFFSTKREHMAMIDEPSALTQWSKEHRVSGATKVLHSYFTDASTSGGNFTFTSHVCMKVREGDGIRGLIQNYFLGSYQGHFDSFLKLPSLISKNPLLENIICL